MNDIQAIDKAAERLQAAKNTERLATAARIRAEEDLLLLLPPNKPEGSTTTRGGEFKITATGVINRSIDGPALEAIRPSIPAALFDQAVAYKPSLIAAGLKHLQNNEPATYALLAQAITAKPGKTSVTVERIAAGDEQREAA